MNIFEKYHFLCGWCLENAASSVHEIIPRSAGGKLTEDNQIPLCARHHAMIQADWRAYVDGLYNAQARAKRIINQSIVVGGSHDDIIT